MATAGNMALRILVVDDDTLVGDSIRKALEFDHHTVEIVTSSQEALARFQIGRYDLLIVDYEMPAMKGDKLAALIKARDPGQPILMITAYCESLRLSGQFPLAVDQVVSKPFDLQDFCKTVRQVVAKA